MALRVLVLLLAVLGIAYGGYRFGVKTEGNAWRAEQLEQTRLANQARARNDQIAADARVSAAQQQADQEQRYAALNERYRQMRRTVPIVVSKPTAAPATGDSPGAARGIVVLAAADPALSNGAVWMWNSALAGRADVPPSACRADGGSGEPDPSCSEDSGLTVDDAWNNHAINAQICARNAARLTRLVDYLKRLAQP